MVCEGRTVMDMSGEGGASGVLQQRWYDNRVNGSPAAADVNGEVDGFFHSPLDSGHHSRIRYPYTQQMNSYSAAVSSHGKHIEHFNLI